MLAQIPAPVVVNLGIVGRERERALEVLHRLLVVAEHRVHQAVDVVRRRIAGVGLHGEIELLDRDVHLRALVIAAGQLGVHPCPLRRACLRLLRRRNARLLLGCLRSRVAPGQHRQGTDGN